MKFAILIALFINTAFASRIKIEDFDQLKMAGLIAKLPSSVLKSESVNVTEPVAGVKTTSVFETSGMKIECVALYYGGSQYMSSATCKVDVDLTNAGVAKKNSEVRVTMTDSAVVKALYENIPYGKGEEKDFRGWERDNGIDFDGIRSPLFHYIFNCTKTQCLAKFSAYNLVP